MNETKTVALCVNNVVSDNTLKEIQQRTLEQIAGFLKNSFGPYGSTTCIKKLNALNVYTKDGHNILSNISFNGIIEQSIKDDVESITRHIVKTVGDGTTSAVLLSDKIFKSLRNNDDFNHFSPAVLLREFNSVVDEICEKIKSNGRECTIDDIYDIAMISSNGDEKISSNIRSIYEQYGMNVFIDVAISNGVNDMLKAYDGVTFEAGFADPCYITDTEHNSSVIRNAHIYYFADPIDTPEMGSFLDSIIVKNILMPLSGRPDSNGVVNEVVPTVVICPRISRDASSTIESLMDQYMKAKPAQRPPFVLVSGYSDYDTIADIMKLCGGRTIRKYIDPNIQKADIESGKAPDNVTVCDWYGLAEEVVVNSTHTKFINPAKMYDKDGNKSNIYTSLVEFLEKEVSVAEQNGENAGVVGGLKRRLNALNSNMVEYLVGGITVADRDSVRDLVEDAVKNCRSAAKNGVGYAANFEAYNATDNMDAKVNSIRYTMISNIHKAYEELITILYNLSDVSTEMREASLYDVKRPINLRDMNIAPKCNVLSSIESDIIILKAVSQIIGIMFTTNQFIVPSPAHNIYVDF